MSNSIELDSRSSSYTVCFNGKEYVVVYSFDDNSNYYQLEVFDTKGKLVVDSEEIKDYFIENCKD